MMDAKEGCEEDGSVAVDEEKNRRRRSGRRSRQVQGCTTDAIFSGGNIDIGARESLVEDTFQYHSKYCSTSDGMPIQGLTKNSEYAQASTSSLDSKKPAPLPIQKSKLREATMAVKQRLSPGLTQECNAQSSCIPQFSKEETVKASGSSFRSLPSMHVNADSIISGHSPASSSLEDRNGGPLQHNSLLESAKSCPESRFHGALNASPPKNECLPNRKSKGSPDLLQRKFFMPYWSVEAVNEALQKGVAFRASFRVNVHNRLEGYCSLDGMPIDVLISGDSAQNRAIEGDVVAIVLDPVSLWTKLKGAASKQTVNDAGIRDAGNAVAKVMESVGVDFQKNYMEEAKCKVDDVHTSRGCAGMLVLNGSSDVEPGEDSGWDPNFEGHGFQWFDINENADVGEASNALDLTSMFMNLETRPLVDDDTKFQTGESFSSCESFDMGSVNKKDEAVNALAKIIAIVKSLPGKRPTGKVVAIIENSPRRDAVIGFLEVKQWLAHKGWPKGGCSRSEQPPKKNRKGIPSSTVGGSIKLIPTDARFPKMIVFVSSLPDCIRKRLHDGDPTVVSELVAARIDAWRADSSLPLAVVKQSLGQCGELEAQTTAILFEHSIHSSDFPPNLLACLPKVPWKIPPKEIQKRRDLRRLRIFSIDPTTARDLDDTLSIESIGDGVMRVGVHIADVSFFVLPGTDLDIEARGRSTSVYIIQRMLPMLPQLLCEDFCSLNPGVDRLAFSVTWDIHPSGEILNHWIGRTVIKSCCKLSYQHAQDIIDGTFDCKRITSWEAGGPELHGAFEWSDIIADIRCLHEIAKKRRNSRFEKGALKLDNSKLIFALDEDGMPCDSILYEHKDSNIIVEEFMVLANITVAKVISRAFPESALLRRHPEPSLRKLKDLESFCVKHGFELDISSAGQLHLSLEKMRDKLKDDPVLLKILVMYATKPMQLAKYFCTGELRDKETDWAHYALATSHYTHFTSPIRRYPDIVVHRTLAAALEAEEIYLKQLMSKGKKGIQKNGSGSDISGRCFTSIVFDKEAAESADGKKALAAAALKHKVPGTAELALVAAHCNERNLASRNVREASDKLYLWAFLKKKETLISDAKVLALGPKFMSVYIYKLAMERRIYIDEIEGLIAEWFELTSTLLLDIYSGKCSRKKSNHGKYRTVEDVALVVNPVNAFTSSIKQETYEDILREVQERLKGEYSTSEETDFDFKDLHDNEDIEPAVLPLTLHLLSSVPVSIHAVGGDSKPPDIAVRLYLSSYLS